MAFTLRNFAALSRRNAAAPLSAVRFVQRASYQTSAVRFAGKESALSRDTPFAGGLGTQGVLIVGSCDDCCHGEHSLYRHGMYLANVFLQ